MASLSPQSAQLFARELQSLFAHDKVLAGQPRFLGIAEDLKPADHHVLSCDVALRFANQTLSAAEIIFGELSHQRGRSSFT